MLNKSFVAIAMLGFVFTATAFGQKELVIWTKAKGAKNVKRAPQQPKPGGLIDTSTGEIVWADEVKSNQPNSSQQRTARKPQAGNLIDTSTGEIVWVNGKNPNSSRMKATGTAGNTTAKGQLRPKRIGGGAAGGALVGGAVVRTTTPRRAR